jgi:hypothetical protein
MASAADDSELPSLSSPVRPCGNNSQRYRDGLPQLFSNPNPNPNLDRRKKTAQKKIIQPKLPYQPQVLGDFRNSFFVFVSDRSRSGLAENLGQIRFS